MSTFALRKVGGEPLVSFRLSDLPEQIREKGVDAFERAELRDSPPWEALKQVAAVRQAADRPSDTRYWIAKTAWRRVMG